MNAAELSAIALERSSLPTSSTRNDWRAGRSNALNTPKNRASASTIHGRTTPPLTTAASITAWTSAEVWVTRIRRRLSTRSATTPAHSENTRTGRNWRNARRPSMNADDVRRCISQPCATLCIQVPIRETSWPVQNNLKFRWRRARNREAGISSIAGGMRTAR